jgi:hypothetical protein
VAAAAGAGCSDSTPVQETVYLLRVGEDVITVLEFEKAVELAKAAYPHRMFQEPKAERAVQLRVLREMTEELILRQRARELGLSVSEAELSEAEGQIRADYPEGVFEETLLENAVSYSAWKEKLRSRLLAQKLIDQDLASQIRISAQDVAAYYKAHREELDESDDPGLQSPPKAVDERIVENLRRIKAEEAYGDWIDSLRQKYLIDLNISQWRRITGS